MAAPQHAPAALEHVWPRGTTYDERGVLQLGGCDALELAREFGTPVQVVVEDDLRARAREVLDAFERHAGGNYEVHFASKAFPCSAVLRLFAEEGLACDVAGGGELALALRAGFAPERIHLHGNAKTDRELEEAVAAGIGDVVLDNHDDIDRLERLLPADAHQRVLLRIAPGVAPDTHPGISTGGPNTKFGFNPQDAERAIERLQAAPERFELDGLHMHIGSQIMDLAPFRPALEAMAKLGAFRTWNLGGGLGVAYLAGDRPPSFDEYVRTKVGLVRELVGPDARIADEPGRALVANCAVNLYTVQSTKTNVLRWVGVDGGMSDNMRPMLYGARYEVEVVGRPGGATQCHVAGKHCESTDVLVRDALLDDPRPGDVLAMPAAGAYGYAMANNYNGSLRPPIVFVKDGDARVVVRRETYDDLLDRDIA
ncbi:diaminopimelate decarboxylase [Conexibacter sp. SYSU D00693]|uniref:diaminopimelate decarboxylase n=1 Tax=Conexibacter sp. SYSU D00693 TaxID=2812560 RepID=UPI00196A84C9|nr:diaminopimelate decarboxylase [Conexibacter sp. SYSU D00693]